MQSRWRSRVPDDAVRPVGVVVGGIPREDLDDAHMGERDAASMLSATGCSPTMVFSSILSRRSAFGPQHCFACFMNKQDVAMPSGQWTSANDRPMTCGTIQKAMLRSGARSLVIPWSG